MKLRLRRLALVLGRDAERVIPLDVLWFIYFPLAVFRAVRNAPRADRSLPARRLPAAPEDRRPSAAECFRFSLTQYLRQPVMGWVDRLNEARWQARFTVIGMDRLDRALSGPVVIATVHTRGLVLMSSWLYAHGVDMSSVTSEPDMTADPYMRMRFEVLSGGRRPGRSRVFWPGDGRAMAEYLSTGGALLVTLDVARGRTVVVPWRDGQMRVPTGAFRLARLSNATVVPMIATETGRWRWRILVGEPIPAELISGERFEEAASWFADQVLPEAARHPRQAHISLVVNLFRADPREVAAP